MATPTLKLLFIPNAFTDAEGAAQVKLNLKLQAVKDSPGHWALPERHAVEFPTGDTIWVMAEVTRFGNYFHAVEGNPPKRRLCSLKTTGSMEVVFLLPSGEEAYAELSLGKKAVIGDS